MLVGTSDELLHLKIDYESSQISVLSNLAINIESHCGISDESNKRRFLIYNFDTFFTGNLVGDQIVLDSGRQFSDGSLRWPKLNGSVLIGFRYLDIREDGISLYQFCKMDLITSTEELFDLSFPHSDSDPTTFLDLVSFYGFQL